MRASATTSRSGGSLAATWHLDAARFPVLRDHGLAGKAVLPLAVTIEWFVAAATAVSGRPLVSLEDVRVFRGVTVGAEACDVSVWVRAQESCDNGGAARVGSPLARFTSSCAVAPNRCTCGPLQRSDPRARAGADGPAGRARHVRRADRPCLCRAALSRAVAQCIETVEGMGESRDGRASAGARHVGTAPPGPAVPWTVDPLVLDGVFQSLDPLVPRPRRRSVAPEPGREPPRLRAHACGGCACRRAGSGGRRDGGQRRRGPARPRGDAARAARWVRLHGEPDAPAGVLARACATTTLPA